MSTLIDPEHDHLIPIVRLVEARLGRRPSPATVWRWRLRGVRAGGVRIRLEAVRVAGVWHTTPAAWAAFIAAQTEAAAEPRAIEKDEAGRPPETMRRLQDAGLLPADEH